jgi:hypothetical protein
VAATLTDSGELTYFSFGIEKIESTPDGDLMVFGRASDGSVDSDQQIVDPKWMAKAIQEWISTGPNLRVQHNPQRDPAGVGLTASTDADGATWVKALVVEPVAKRLVSKGALRAYSVGISRPTIERDVTGKARGGIITAGSLAEVSLVDRPANKNCGVQLVKNAGTEYVNEVFGDQDTIQKMLGSTLDQVPIVPDIDQFEAPMTDFKFTPNDLAKIVRDKIIEEHYSDLAIKAIIEAESAVYKRDVNTAERRSLASSGRALPDGSYPIANAGDLHNAAHLAATGHGNAEAAKRLIARRAQELGVANPLDEQTKAEETISDVAVPDAVKDQNGESGPSVPPKIPGSGAVGEPPESPAPESAESACKADDEAVKAAKPMAKPKKGKKGKSLPPWLNKPSSDADDCKVDHVHTEKCHTDPKTASGAREAADMQPAPVGELMESPAKPHMKFEAETALMRFKTIGIDADMGILHDLTCPAFHPDEVSKYFPYADFSMIDENVWSQKALTAAAGKSLSQAMEAQQAWQAATVLKNAEPADLYEFRIFQYKAFRDANPGPTSFPTPGAMSAQRFCRPNLGGGSGHSQDSSGYGSPNSAPQVAASAPNAQHFDRPPLGSGHQSPSPSFMKGGFEYPAEQGTPVRLTYSQLENDKARRALVMMHDHLQHQFPQGCPMVEQDAYRVEQPAPQVPAVVGIGKSETAAMDPEIILGDVQRYIAKLEKKVRAGLITEDQARAKLSKRTAEKYAASVSAQVQKGITSRDEILKALGLPPELIMQKAQPAEAQVPVPETFGARQGDDVTKGLSPEVMKTMMSEILEPFQAKISAQEETINAYQQREAERDAQIAQLLENNNRNNQRWEDLANKADPSTEAFHGLALNPLVSRPAGVVKQAEAHKARADEMMRRELEHSARTSENPAEREAAWTALYKLQGNQ